MNQAPAVDPGLTVFEKLLYLRRGQTAELARSVSAGQLSAVADQMRDRAFTTGAVLMREGEAPLAAYSLVRGRVQVSRRGQVLGEVGPGAAIGIRGIFSRDVVGLGAVATTDVLALELDRDVLVDIFEDVFPFLLETIKAGARRHLDFIRRMTQVPDQLPPIQPEPFLSGPLDFVRRLLLLKTPGGPFERSALDALAEVAQAARHRSFDAGSRLWSEGDRADAACLVIDGTIACSSARDDGSVEFRVGRGAAIGALEAIAARPRWHDAVAETKVELLDLHFDDVFDVFEDNVDMAMDFLAWMSSDALHLVETTLGPGRELLDFFTGSSD